MVEFARIIEDTWEHAPPGREAVERNEALRTLQELLRPRPPAPRFTLVAIRTAH
jgi:hypothetical protein